MPAREAKRYPRPGYSSANDAWLEIIDRVPDDSRPLDFTDHTVASFTLHWNEENNEVQLIKGDEIVYSEIFS